MARRAVAIGPVLIQDEITYIFERDDGVRIGATDRRLFINYYPNLSISCTLFGDTSYCIMYDQLDYAKRQIDKSFTNIKECVIASYTLSILDAFLHYFHPPTIKQITRDRIITTELTIVNWRFDGADMIGEIDGVQRKYKHCDYLQSTHSYDIKNTEHVLAYEFNKVMETITKELPQPIAEDVNWFLKP